MTFEVNLVVHPTPVMILASQFGGISGLSHALKYLYTKLTAIWELDSCMLANAASLSS